MSASLEKVLNEVRTLTPEEIKLLRDELDALLTTPHPRMSEDEFEQHLLDKGIISRVPPPITDLTPYRERQPVEILDGKPVSETIVEERR
ncbi:MAG: hypothetical protein H0T63_00320 [Pyrinomonadaceae bacterium]|jgi:hypothetical protein|nr:hypothetical protein [Pyrinomonadaceae bacterium]MCA1626632.1 hypothetical protein [Acidobacteriota bacterium]MDQ3584480.1 hypothetical protein [Acidobacteriota bacterium]